MFKKMDSNEFEYFCQSLFEIHFNCRVTITQQTRDEGIDLIIHHTSGNEIVECKHWPNGTVGRPVVQKLHSAILNSGAKKGIIVTTGQFSSEASTYAANLNDVKITLIDKTKLDYIVQTSGIAKENNLSASKSIATIKEIDFEDIFIEAILKSNSESFDLKSKTNILAKRFTSYKAYYVGSYEASGFQSTAGGTFSRRWNGTIWLDSEGKTWGFDSPRKLGTHLSPTNTFAEVLRQVPGKSQAPSLELHQAKTKIKELILKSCESYHGYRGRNNVWYQARIKPSAQNTNIFNLNLFYLPEQFFEIRRGKTVHSGYLEESDDPSEFRILCESFSKCSICGSNTDSANQMLCPICFNSSHKKGFIFQETFFCPECQRTVCRNDTVYKGFEKRCKECHPGGRALEPTWFWPLFLGLIFWFFLLASTLTLINSGSINSFTKTQLLILVSISIFFSITPYIFSILKKPFNIELTLKFLKPKK